MGVVFLINSYGKNIMKNFRWFKYYILFFILFSCNIYSAEYHKGDDLTRQITSSLKEINKKSGSSNNTEAPLLLPDSGGSSSSSSEVIKGLSSESKEKNDQEDKLASNSDEAIKTPLPEEVARIVAEAGSPTDEDFIKALKEKYPLSSEQIRTFKERADIDDWDKSEQISVPKPLISTMTANLEPGTTPTVIKIATGYVTSLVFVDETGAPWPIAGYAVGDKSAFQINWDKSTNIMFIETKKKYASTNLILQMADLNVPVLFTVVSDQNEVFYRLDIRVPSRGPNAKVHTYVGGGAGNNSLMPTKKDNLVMTNLLDGIPPPNSKPIQVRGGKAIAWLLNDGSLLLRTKLTVLSPNWNAIVNSSDGMHVYRLKNVPVILASENGRTLQLVMAG